MKIHDKLLFMFYKTFELSNANEFIDIWQSLARENGLNGFFFIGQIVNTNEIDKIYNLNLDSINILWLGYVEMKSSNKYLRFIRWVLKIPRIVTFKNVRQYFVGKEEELDIVIPTIIPSWDHSPRQEQML